MTAHAAPTIGTTVVETYFKVNKNCVADTYTSTSGTKLPYRLWLPTDYDPNKSYPLVLFFHGAGEAGSDNTHIFRGGSILQRLLHKEEQEKHPCIILAPQTVCDGATNKYEWVASGSGIPGIHQWDGAAGGLKIREGRLEDIPHTIGMRAAEALLKDFISSNRVDEQRIYVGGISMGGCATWEILARNPELFAAAVPLCGSAILSSAPLLTDVAIWAFHGTGDKTVWTEGTTRMVEAIRAAGGEKGRDARPRARAVKTRDVHGEEVEPRLGDELALEPAGLAEEAHGVPACHKLLGKRERGVDVTCGASCGYCNGKLLSHRVLPFCVTRPDRAACGLA
jgi:predicted esterase